MQSHHHLKSLIFVIFAALLFNIQKTTQKNIQISPDTIESDQNIRLNQIKYINQPDINLSNVYKREVHEVKNGTINEFSPCKQSPPELSLSATGFYQLSNSNTNSYLDPSNPIPKRQRVIYDFQQLKRKQHNIIDMYYNNNKIFTISSQGILNIYLMNDHRMLDLNGYNIALNKSIKVIDWEKQKQKYNVTEQSLNKGYFISLQNGSLLLFCNDAYVILLKIDTLEIIVFGQSQTYLKSQQFQTVIKLDQKHFATLDQKNGVNIYQLNFNSKNQYSLSLINNITKNHFNQLFGNEQLSLMDMAYDSKRQILFILDYQKGILPFQKESVQASNLKEFTFAFSYITIRKKMCNIMIYSEKEQNLYLSCNKIHKISTSDWPVTQQKIYPHPLINIKQIFVQPEQKLLILAGNNVFKVMYMDRTVQYYEDDLLDRIIFQNGIAITANQNHIITLNYRVEKPTIMCQTSDRNYLGTHNLIFKTTAECNLEYIKNISQNSFIEPQDNDICVYTTYKNVYIWSMGSIPIKPLSILLLLFMIFLIVMLIWLILVKFRMNRAENHLKYISEEGHINLIQQQVPKSQKYNDQNPQKSGQSFHNPTQQNKNTEQQDPNKDLYSIQ